MVMAVVGVGVEERWPWVGVAVGSACPVGALGLWCHDVVDGWCLATFNVTEIHALDPLAVFLATGTDLASVSVEPPPSHPVRRFDMACTVGVSLFVGPIGVDTF